MNLALILFLFCWIYVYITQFNFFCSFQYYQRVKVEK